MFKVCDTANASIIHDLNNWKMLNLYLLMDTAPPDDLLWNNLTTH